MNKNHESTGNRVVMPVAENLEKHAGYVLKWVPHYQMAPRVQRSKHLAYTPDVTCGIEQLVFDATVSAAHGHTPHYHFSVAAPLALTYAALALTATEEFMPEIPLDRSLTLREAPGNTVSHNFVDYRYLRHFQGGVHVIRRTDDRRRHPIGDSLFSLCLQMIALHEEGHYLNGHLETNLSFSAAGTHSERHELTPPASEDDLLTSRALELDADHFATITMLSPLCAALHGDEQRARRHAANLQCELGRTSLGYMRFVASASTLLGMILWQAEGGMAGPPANRRTHPSPLCRVVHFAHTVSTIVSVLAQNDNEAQVWNETVNRDVTEITKFFGFEDVIDLRPDADTPWVKEWRGTRQRLLQLKPTMSETAIRARIVVGLDPEIRLPGDFDAFLTVG